MKLFLCSWYKSYKTHHSQQARRDYSISDTRSSVLQTETGLHTTSDELLQGQ